VICCYCDGNIIPQVLINPLISLCSTSTCLQLCSPGCSMFCCCLFVVCWTGWKRWCSAPLTDWGRVSYCAAQLTQDFEYSRPETGALLSRHFLNDGVIGKHTYEHETKAESVGSFWLHNPHCVASPVFNNSLWKSKNWDQSLDLWERNVVPFLSDRILTAQPSWIFCLLYFVFYDEMVKGPDCRQISPAPELFYYEAMLP